MRFLRRSTGLLILSGLVFTSGCGNQPAGSGAALTAEQQAAVDSVYAQVEAVATALTGIVDSFEGIDANGDASFGECPVIDAIFAGGVATITLTFPDGCVNDYYGTSPVTGSISVVFDTAARTFGVTFNDFVTTNGTVTGTMALTLNRTGLEAALTGTIDIAISGVGFASGSITLQIDADAGIITIADATLTLTPETGTAFAVTIDSLVLQPIASGNFIPEAGTISFGIPISGPGPETISVLLTFDTQSPIDRTVSVHVGTADPVEYQIGGAPV